MSEEFEDAIVMAKKLTTISRAQNNEESSGPAGSLIALIIDGTSLVYILNSELEEQVIAFRIISLH